MAFMIVNTLMNVTYKKRTLLQTSFLKNVLVLNLI